MPGKRFETICQLTLAHELFPGLLDYMEHQPSATRIDVIGATFVEGALGSGTISGRHQKGMRQDLMLAWGFGSAVGVLDLLGEVPEQMPALLR